MANKPGMAGDSRIAPPQEFVEQANVTDPEIYTEFDENWPECWERAASFLDWEQDHDSVLKSMEHPPYYRWFDGGKVNACENCVDRHVRAGRGEKPALRWIGEGGETETYTYSMLHREVNEVAAMLRKIGVTAGDPVALYMPRLPALLITMLAAARLGAPHVVVFAEYSGSILSSFMRETGAQTLVTCDGYYKDGEFHALNSKAANGVEELPWDVTTVTLSHAETDETPDYGLDYRRLREECHGAEVTPVPMAADDPLFICYASGPTGEPIGMKHVVGEYLSYVAWTGHAVLDIKPEDTFWCPAGIEWITGHSYVVYAPLALGATSVLYEGAPSYPDKHRPWRIIESNDVTQFYTTPTAIRTFMEWGDEYPAAHDLSSLRLLGTVGQRIEKETWQWFYKHVGNGNCPIVDTWYQAETGGINISTLPGICGMKPGSVGPPLPGTGMSIVDADGDEVAPGQAGYLVLNRPWPGFFRPVQMPDQKAREYWTEFGTPGDDWVYFTEDGAVADEDGYITILGRLDDVINIGHYSKNRVHVSEIERVINELDEVEEVAVVCGQHEIKGEAPYAFVVTGNENRSDLATDVADKVEYDFASQARPETVFMISDLPRTYTGNVLHRVLEDLLNGEPLGNTNLLQNPAVVDKIDTELQHQDEISDPS
jgi:acetyl-CoA synthetase